MYETTRGGASATTIIIGNINHVHKNEEFVDEERLCISVKLAQHTFKFN
jgi:hypothetical protein